LLHTLLPEGRLIAHGPLIDDLAFDHAVDGDVLYRYAHPGRNYPVKFSLIDGTAADDAADHFVALSYHLLDAEVDVGARGLRIGYR